jgi:exosortase B
MTTIVNKIPLWPRPAALQWWPILLGLAVMYAPTYYNLANTIWQGEEQAHGPLVLMVVIYFIWHLREHYLAGTANKERPILGSLSLLIGLLLYVVGRSQDILIFEIGSQIPALIGILLITRGARAIRALWFPLFFIMFMIPLPGFIVDAITGPLKQQVSELAEAFLYTAGYPVARSGVTLTIGQYQLLVADACSGLHSMFSLTAMGLLYLYIMQHRSWILNGVLISSLLPIAFVANTVRVIILVLVTYFFGYEAGQGFVHKFAGILLFIVSLLFLVALDGVLGWFIADRSKAQTR